MSAPDYIRVDGCVYKLVTAKRGDNQKPEVMKRIEDVVGQLTAFLEKLETVDWLTWNHKADAITAFRELGRAVNLIHKDLDENRPLRSKEEPTEWEGHLDDAPMHFGPRPTPRGRKLNL